jgi:hypothetical protein
MLKESTNNNAVKGFVLETENTLKSSQITPTAQRQFESFTAIEFVKRLKGESELDEASKTFIEREERIFALDNLEVKASYNKIKESEIAKYPMVKMILENMVQFLSLPEYKIAEGFVEKLTPFLWDSIIKESLEVVSEKIKNAKHDIKLQNSIDFLVSSDSAYLIEGFKTELDNYYIERSDASRALLIEKLSKVNFDKNILNLIEVVNETSKKFQLKKWKKVDSFTSQRRIHQIQTKNSPTDFWMDTLFSRLTRQG